MPALNALFQRYGHAVAFFVVYIGEAHPSDAWQVPNNLREHVIHASPSNADERSALANLCVTRLSIELPAVVDRFDDATDTAYSGWPERLYLVDRDGRIAYKSRPGPFGFTPAELEKALDRVVGPSSSRKQ